MAEQPCCFCGQRFLGKPLTAYWAWYEDQERLSFVQKAMVECATEKWDPFLGRGLDRTQGTVIWPTACPICGQELEGDANPLYVTLYRGKTRKDLVVPCCTGCLSTIYPVITEGATRLPERSMAGGRGGAPSPADEAVARGDGELPW